MRFRVKTSGLHLLASTVALSLILGTLYFGWYAWPGWYLTGVAHVAIVLAGVDLVLGPALTFIIAHPAKPRRELTRDISMIVAVQFCALIYGSVSIWNGRPLYYAYSLNLLQLVQAQDIGAEEVSLGLKNNPELAPHWYSRPRWIWAPLPEDSLIRGQIVAAAIMGGEDVISMPRYFKHWDQGLPALKTMLKTVDDVGYFAGSDKTTLKERMRAAGLATDRPNSMPLTGRGRPLLAVFDPDSLRLSAILRPS